MSANEKEPVFNDEKKDAHFHSGHPPAYHSVNAAESLSGSCQDDSMSIVVAENSLLLPRRGSQDQIQVFKRRWYILILFSIMSGTQGGIWNTFGPISSTAEEAFGWTDSDIGLLTNWGPISFVLSIFPLIWALEHKGLRVASLISAFLMAAGTIVRVFTMEPPAVTYLMNIGQMLNGLAGPIAMAGPPALSAIWFPPEQRTRATAVGTIFGSLGTASGFLLGPNIVPDVIQGEQNKTDRIHKEKAAICVLMYVECVWACVIFIAMLIYFPRRPSLPPSTSAAVQRENFFSGIRRIIKIPQFWIVSLSYAVSQGVLNCWMGVINVILKPLGVGEMEAGWIGFIAAGGGCFLSLIFAALADKMKRTMKWFVLCFYILGTISFLVFAISVDKILLEPSKALCWATIVIGCTMIYASTPLIFELACEIVYPTGEGTAVGIMTLLNNIFGGAFLLLLLDPNIGTLWMNWLAVGACAVCIPLLMLMKEHYNRLDLDELRPSLNAEYIVDDPSIGAD